MKYFDLSDRHGKTRRRLVKFLNQRTDSQGEEGVANLSRFLHSCDFVGQSNIDAFNALTTVIAAGLDALDVTDFVGTHIVVSRSANDEFPVGTIVDIDGVDNRHFDGQYVVKADGTRCWMFTTSITEIKP